jgi:hypothetical protein
MRSIIAQAPDPLQTGEHPAVGNVRTLDGIVKHAKGVSAVQRRDLSLGDWVVITTRNSTYSLRVLGDNQYAVSGGWFDQKALSPQRVAVNGCTWGGTAIKNDLVAAPGLFLEFGNRVKTTRIREVRVFRHQDQGTYH